MNAIRYRLYFLAAASSAGLLASIIIYFRDEVIREVFFNTLLTLIVLATICLVGLLFREYGRYKTAGVIVENKIMYVQAAKIDEKFIDGQNSAPREGGIEIFISCFGILLDSRVIKFNQVKIRLKSVEIGRKFISLSYGTDLWTQTIRILHGGIDKQEMRNVVERFRYETGVVPVATD